MGLAQEGTPAPGSMCLKTQKDAVSTDVLRAFYTKLWDINEFGAVVTAHGASLTEVDMDKVRKAVESKLGS